MDTQIGYNQKIECTVRDCVHCMNGCVCSLNKINVSNDTMNACDKHNTMCQSYEEKIN